MRSQGELQRTFMEEKELNGEFGWSVSFYGKGGSGI